MGWSNKRNLEGVLSVFKFIEEFSVMSIMALWEEKVEGSLRLSEVFMLQKIQLIQGTLGYGKQCGWFVRCAEMRLRLDLGNSQLFNPESLVY